MPVYSGLDLTDVIKGDPQVRGITVIMDRSLMVITETKWLS